jgi:hypothetical protein
MTEQTELLGDKRGVRAWTLINRPWRRRTGSPNDRVVQVNSDLGLQQQEIEAIVQELQSSLGERQRI